MTTYTAIANGDIDQDSPVTQPLMTAMRDNPIAMAEGASGAPKFAIKTQVATDSAGNTDIVSLDDFGGLVAHISFRNPTGGGEAMSIEFSDDGVTFYGTASILTLPMGENGTATVAVDFASGVVRGTSSYATGVDTVSTTVSGASLAVETVRFVTSSSSVDVAILAMLTGGESSS